jgi:hypothetical protein
MDVINAQKMGHVSYIHVSYILQRPYCSLLHAERCYCFVFGTVPNKIQ